MKTILLTVFSLAVSLASFSQCNDIFMSEYVHGWSANRAIEIYNPTSNSVDLSAYQLKRYSNGSTSASSLYTIQLSGVVPAKGTFVIVSDTAQGTVWDSLYAKADTFVCPDYNANRTFFFNGNDAMVLFKGSSVVDVIGKVGEDPGTVNGANNGDPDYGWPTGVPVAWTIDHTLIRKSTILTGNTVVQPVSYVPATEWDSLPIHSFDDLGSHTCDCNSIGVEENSLDLNFVVYPNPSTTGSITILAAESAEKVVVYSVLGKTIIEKQLAKGTTLNKLSTNGWDKGVYFVSLNFGKGKISTKKVTIN